MVHIEPSILLQVQPHIVILLMNADHHDNVENFQILRVLYSHYGSHGTPNSASGSTTHCYSTDECGPSWSCRKLSNIKGARLRMGIYFLVVLWYLSSTLYFTLPSYWHQQIEDTNTQEWLWMGTSVIPWSILHLSNLHSKNSRNFATSLLKTFL